MSKLSLRVGRHFFLVYLRVCKTSRGNADMKFMAPWTNGLVPRLTRGDETAATVRPGYGCESGVVDWSEPWKGYGSYSPLIGVATSTWLDLYGTCIKRACRVFAKGRQDAFEMQGAFVSLTIHWLCYTLLSPRSRVNLELFSTNLLPICVEIVYCPLQATWYSPTLSLTNQMFTHLHVHRKICLYKNPTHKQGHKNIKNVKGCRDGMPKSIQTRCRDPKIHNPSLHPA